MTCSSIEFSDDYEHSDFGLEYVLENVLYEGNAMEKCDEFENLQEQYNSVLMKPCQCFPDSDCCGCFHGGNYRLVTNSTSSELVLNRSGRNDLIYECSTMCECNRNKTKCLNRLVQYGPRSNLKIVYSNLYKSKGLITTVNITQGAFICEYAGEILTHAEAQRRTIENERNHRMNYIMYLNEMEEGGASSVGAASQIRQITIVDPSCRGNIGRYLNHSCTPNCEIYSVRVDCPVPKIAIFAKRKILAGEELCFHYNDGIKSDDAYVKRPTPATPCLCASENCEQYLPNVTI